MNIESKGEDIIRGLLQLIFSLIKMFKQALSMVPFSMVK